MFTPKTALFTFFAACALGVVACQPTDGPALSPSSSPSADAESAKAAVPAAQPATPAPAR